MRHDIHGLENILEAVAKREFAVWKFLRDLWTEGPETGARQSSTSLLPWLLGSQACIPASPIRPTVVAAAITARCCKPRSVP